MLRLVKLQVATQEHECSECVEPVKEGERYNRVAIPPNAEAFPDPTVFQEDAWRFVDRSWVILKMHEGCYMSKFFKPYAVRNA